MEKIFFEYDDVKVTNSRFINGANTYAMAGVTSIMLREKYPNMKGVYLLSFLSLLAIYFAITLFFVNALFWGLLIPAVMLPYYAYSTYKKAKKLYAIVLTTSAGETDALISDQIEYTKLVHTALNEALIFRE